MNKNFLYLLIITISIVSTYSYDNGKYFHDDNDMNEIFHEKIIENYYYQRVRRAGGVVYDGSGDTSNETTTTYASTITTQTSISSTTTTSLITSRICNSSAEIEVINGICMLPTDAQKYVVELLRSRTGDSTTIANALSVYINVVTITNASLDSDYTLLPNEIDEFVGSLNGILLNINSQLSFIMSQQRTNVSTLGASFIRGSGGMMISGWNEQLNPASTAAVVFKSEPIVGIASVNIFIIDKPITYSNIDNSNNKRLASSVIVAAIHTTNSNLNSTNISLYFRVLDEYKPTGYGSYLCAFYDTIYLRWNNSGCTLPQYNSQFNRYECSCNHLTTFALIWSASMMSCNNSDHVQLPNGTCIFKPYGQAIAVDLLRSNSTDSSAVANALSLYINSVTNSNSTLNSTYTLPLPEIDTYLGTMMDTDFIINGTDSFLLVTSPTQNGNIIVLGAAFTRNIGGEVVNIYNKETILISNFSAGAIILNESLADVASLNMMIIDKPSAFTNIDNSSNRKLASSIIMVSLRRNNGLNPMNISLYFRVLDEYKPNVSAIYLCTFYDSNTLQWNESGCTLPIYNQQFDRHECSCNHLTSFALIWLPQSLLTNSSRTLDAQDIASLIFQAISIVSFLAVIAHAIYIRIKEPLIGFESYHLLPLISSASTTILFIFYIVLGMTVYTRTPSENETKCFLSSSILMFFVYFFLIFMFCVKTSVGYFNYLRFVYLFPQPSARKLFVMLLISFIISITWVSFAAGFNSNSSFSITQLYPYKLCWFTHNVLYYFLTIPACLFILINIITFTLVAIHILKHVQNSTSFQQMYERMKRCVLVLLSSCFTQGIGWLFGPFISLISPTAGIVLGWFFIIFNGLEGFWTIVLYIIIKSQRIDESKRIQAAKERFQQKKLELIDKSNSISKEERRKRRNDEEFRSLTKPELKSTKLPDDDVTMTRF